MRCTYRVLRVNSLHIGNPKLRRSFIEVPDIHWREHVANHSVSCFLQRRTAASLAALHPSLLKWCPLLLTSACVASPCTLHTIPSPPQIFFSILLLANFSCHLLTFSGPLASPSCIINSIVSSIFEIVVIDGAGMNVEASSAWVGPVDDGLRIKIGFEVFFCRIWYFFSP